jgi:phage tail-like protein
LRVDFYKLLLPELKAEDQRTGSSAFLDVWDDPQAEIAEWDATDPFIAVWDRVGLKPVIQRIFWCLETEHGKLLDEIDSMEDLQDPDKCPEKYLGYIASSLGYDLDDALTVKEKRETIKGILIAYKEHGTPISWQVFYRMLGFRILFYPLWKKEYAEDQDRYSRDRFVTTTPFGPLVITAYTPTLPQAPLRPSAILITDGTETFRDDGKGRLIGNLGGYGTVNYLTGAIDVHFKPPGPVGPITLTGETVNEEYPYHAARVDMDFFLVPIKGGPAPAVTPEFITKILTYLEEVRPIHVLIRTFNLILTVDDELTNFVTDSLCCGPSLGVDHYALEDKYYAGDVGPRPEDSNLTIDKGGADKQVIVDDLTPFINPFAGDPLVITSSPAQPHDGAY